MLIIQRENDANWYGLHTKISGKARPILMLQKNDAQIISVSSQMKMLLLASLLALLIIDFDKDRLLQQNNKLTQPGCENLTFES